MAGAGSGWILLSLLATVGIALLGAVVLAIWFLIVLVAHRRVGLLKPMAIVGACLLVGGIAATWIGTQTWAANPADDQLAPLTSQLRADGATTICTDGDAGIGPDNTEPWASAYLRVPSDRSSEAALRALAEQQGYRVRSAPTGTAERGKAPDLALEGRRGRWTVSIDRYDGAAPIYCGSPYGRLERPGTDRTIVTIEVSGPRR